MNGRKGQEIFDYVLIIVLIVILIIIGVKLFGGKIKYAFSNSGNVVEQQLDNTKK